MKRALWHKHPGVRSGDDLTLGEKAADHLKAAFGSWAFMIILNSIIACWIILNAILGSGAFDPYPFILLNLGLSWLAAQQGGALQIAANRGDRISSELALSTHANGEELLTLNRQQLEILSRLNGLSGDVAGLAEAVRAALSAPAARPGKPAAGRAES